tara:strand:+ start:1958 stop:2206 length:249 start_codon:yes stop_codon:yes gene_type:complete
MKNMIEDFCFVVKQGSARYLAYKDLCIELGIPYDSGWWGSGNCYGTKRGNPTCNAWEWGKVFTTLDEVRAHVVGIKPLYKIY